MRAWLEVLEAELLAARDAGEIDPDAEPNDLAFQLNALAAGANTAFQLHDDPQVLDRARRVMRGLVTGVRGRKGEREDVADRGGSV